VGAGNGIIRDHQVVFGVLAPADGDDLFLEWILFYESIKIVQQVFHSDHYIKNKIKKEENGEISL
jgi:hypothetical protein